MFLLQQYLFDNTESTVSLSKEKGVVNEWSFLGNQIFVGVLGSLVIPRQEIRKLLGILNDAGVRFVYFSPRNMRRQKELAIQMGIDVAWNCAISLRPLESGEDDPHRMVSNYADWDVNAKLPHGVHDVRIHLQEVDNGKSEKYGPEDPLILPFSQPVSPRCSSSPCEFIYRCH
jgi:hypothetical protein